MTDEEKIKELKKEYCPKCAKKELCESETPLIKHCLDRRDGSVRDKPKWFKMLEDEANVKAEEYCRNTCIWRGMGKCFDNCKNCLVYKIFLDGYWVGRKESKDDDFYNNLIDRIIDEAKRYGLVSDSCLDCYLRQYENKEITYDELHHRLLNEAILELNMAVDDMRKAWYWENNE